jgi:hypothetical protein
MQRFSNMRCIVSSNVVYAKKSGYPYGYPDFFVLELGLERPVLILWYCEAASDIMMKPFGNVNIG